MTEYTFLGLVPKAVIQDGKVMNADVLKRYWERYWERKWIIQRGIFNDLREAQPEVREPEVVRTEVIHRHSDMSSKEFARLQSLEGEVKYLRQKLEEIQTKAKPKQQGYRGIK